jgi:hypothetical protein
MNQEMFSKIADLHPEIKNKTGKKNKTTCK